MTLKNRRSTALILLRKDNGFRQTKENRNADHNDLSTRKNSRSMNLIDILHIARRSLSCGFFYGGRVRGHLFTLFGIQGKTERDHFGDPASIYAGVVQCEATRKQRSIIEKLDKILQKLA